MSFPNSVNSSLDIKYLEGAKHLENYILWEWWKDLSYMKDFYVPLKQYIVLHETLWNNTIFNFKTFRYFDTVVSVSLFFLSPSPFTLPPTTCRLFKQVLWIKLQFLWFKFPNSVNSSLDIQYLEGVKHLENFILSELWKDLCDMKDFYVQLIQLLYVN